MIKNKIHAVKGLRDLFDKLELKTKPIAPDGSPFYRHEIYINGIPDLKTCKDFIEAVMELGVTEYLMDET